MSISIRSSTYSIRLEVMISITISYLFIIHCN